MAELALRTQSAIVFAAMVPLPGGQFAWNAASRRGDATDEAGE